jgi:hypothetical protein
MIETVLAGLAGAALFLALRLYPIWPSRFQGCDAYNILLCAETVRRTRRLPPRLPGLFLLEDEAQWYPPVFFVLCALVPQGWLRHRYWLLNQLVDLANAGLLYGVVVAATASPVAGLAAIVAYAMMAGLVQEFAALTTRPLGLLVLNLLLLTGHLATQDARWLPLALACGVLLVYGHKLSAQQAWFALPALALATGSWAWAALLPGMYLAAFLAWPRGFRHVIAGHVAIVRFWSRNWLLLGAHMVRQSPVYGDGATRTDFYAAWPGGAPLRFAKETLHQNYFLLPAGVALATDLAAGGLSPLDATLAVWIASVYGAAAAIHFVPVLRGIGLGRQYVKFALLPSLMASAEAAVLAPSWPFWAALAAAVLLTVRQYALVVRAMRAPSAANASGLRAPELDRLLGRLAGDAEARILALPVQLCDLVAYATRRPVYWGTHAQVFDARLEEFFPVLRRRLEDYAAEAGLNRLLLDTRYATPEQLGLDAPDMIERAGDYALYRLQVGSHDGMAVRAEADGACAAGGAT